MGALDGILMTLNRYLVIIVAFWLIYGQFDAQRKCELPAEHSYFVNQLKCDLIVSNVALGRRSSINLQYEHFSIECDKLGCSPQLNLEVKHLKVFELVLGPR